jgi:hypothetical protein
LRQLLAAVWILLLLAPASAAPADQAGDIARAQQSAQAWLQLLDAGRYGDSWDAASSFWRADHTREKTAQVLKGWRAPLGSIRSRKVLKAELLTVPDGDCVHVVFASEFANKPDHVETVDMLREKNGEWKVALWSQRARSRDD